MENKILPIDKIKELNISDLENQANLIRDFIIKNVSKTGGHLSSNLGVVELTLAIHYVFNSPFDKIIFDVGHQDYTHKILTNRKDNFDTLRQNDGLSGFPSYSESEHDVWESGHSSTSIASGIAMAIAKNSGNNDIGEIITVIGDGAISNGLALSSLNYLASNKKNKVIIILNDNDMSISKNVGGMAQRFSKIRITKSYNLFRKFTFKFVRESLKALVYKNNIFTSLGFKYLGPIDGHDLKSLIKYLNYAKNYDESVVLHVKTIKGKGYKYSETDSLGQWHGVNPFDIETGEITNTKPYNEIKWNDIVSNSLINLLNEKDNIIIISPGMINGTGLDDIKLKYPDKVIDVGINEELAIVMGASLSRNGIVPIIPIYSTFLQRSYDELNNDINRSNNHIILLIDHSGVVSHDGSTHQGIYDVSFLSHLNNFIITAPKNQNEFDQLLKLAYRTNNPFAIRYNKGNTIISKENIKIDFGKWVIELPLKEINVLTYGVSVNTFKDEITSSKKNIGLINAIFIKPFDEELLNKLNNSKLIIYEEVVSGGSLYSLISDYVIKNNLKIDVIHYAINDIIKEGTKEEILDKLGLNIQKIVTEI